MKKMYLFALMSLMSLMSYGQTTETEPNNSFATANTTANYSTYFYNASLGGGDAIDYFKPTMRWKDDVGNYRVTLDVTNTGVTSAHFNFKLYNNSQVVIFEENVSSTEVPAGATVSKEFDLCGQYMDDFFIVFSSNGSFDYKFSAYIYNLIIDKEPNNTRNQAIIFNNNEEETSGIQYLQSLGGTQRDEVDYHKILLESGDYDLLTLNINAQNNSCTDGQWIKYECFKNEETTSFATGYVGDNNSVLSLREVKSKISLSDFQQGDYLTFKITASASFGYKFRVGYAGKLPGNVSYDDWEDNDDYSDAIELGESKVKYGNVGEAYFDEENNYWDVYDPYDTYRIDLSQPGDITLYMSALSLNCDMDSYMTVYFDILDEYGNVLREGNEIIPSQWVYCYGDTLGGAVKIQGLNEGIYHIRIYSSYDYEIENGAWINYALFYKAAVSDSPDQEPNDEIEDAILTIPDTTYNGRVGKIGDEQDSYRFIMPHAGAVDFTFKASNDACGENSFLSYHFIDKKGKMVNYANPIFNWDQDAPCDSMQTGHIKIRGLESDTFYIQLIAYEGGIQARGTVPTPYPITYNFSYKFVDQANNDPEPNGLISEAIPVAPGEIKKGRLKFYHSKDSDYFDYYSLNVPSAGNIDLIFKSTSRNDKSVYNQYDNLLSVRAALNYSFLNAKAPGYPKVESVEPDSSYIDTIRICGVGAGPLLIEIRGKPSEYEFHFEIKEEVTDINEIEPNATNEQAQIVIDSSLIKGTIYYFENGAYDDKDIFKIPVYDSDPITLYVKATNTRCDISSDAAALSFIGRRNGGSVVFNKTIANNSYVNAGETIYDTIHFSMPGTDTLFLNVTRLYSNTSFKYEFSTSLFKPTSEFEIKGDTTVCVGAQQYIAGNIYQDNLTYHWRLPEGGGTISWVDSVATVIWTEAGSFPIELYLSNAAGNSLTKSQEVIVNDQQPTIAPEIFNFARNLSTSPIPPGTTVQWFRNETPVNDAIDSVYYAALGGNYTARFINDCGSGPISNPYNFPADAITQSISFPHNANMQMAPQLKIKLSATASSGLPVFYSLISGPCAISNDSLIVNGIGTIILRAEQPGNDEFKYAEAKYDTITVTKGDQVITTKAIPDRLLKNGYVHPGATSSVGLPVSYKIISGNATGGDSVRLTGMGTIIIQAEQKGNANYNAATPVQQTFCVGTDTLTAIKGAATACLGTYTYTVQKIAGANYMWTLSEGGTIVTHNDTAFVTWTVAGNHTLKVKANSDCYAIYSFEPVISVTVDNVIPTHVSNMLPANGATGQSLPLVLSWVPGQYTETYDLYVWDSAASRPATPYKKDIAGISYTIPQSAFPYDETYKWQLISKNPCHANNGGPVHTFRLVPLPDLIVTNVLAPTSAISGQTISITWTVKNDGPGATLATQSWQDNVYLSFDSFPNWDVPPNTNPGGWSMLDFPVKPLLIASKTNVTALQPGEQYSNTINFTLPVNYNFPVYIFVRANGKKSIVETANDNNTDSAVNPIDITLAPTPDLRVDSVFTPNTVFSGAEVNVTYKVKNYGTLTPAGAQWTDQVYISQSQLFDSANAIKLYGMVTKKGFTLDGFFEKYETYYPNAPKALAGVNTQLQQDSIYTGNIRAVIPNFIFGQWFIHVKTNFNRGVYEGPSFGNNVNTNAVQVYLTPTPHLTVNSITLPVSEASTTQPIGLNWVIKNTGFTDNIEKNQGHYKIFPTGINCPCGSSVPVRLLSRGSTGTPVCVGPPEYRDSVAEGNSYWLDRIYISTDPSGLDIENATLLYEYKNGIKQFPGSYYSNILGCASYGIFNTDHALLPNRSFANSAGFTVPQDLEPGTYYLYVYTNPTKTVFEYPGTAEIKRSAPIVIERPDVVAALNVPANAVAGTPVQIEYTISNNGPGSVYNHLRVDQIYVSTTPVFDESATLAATKTYTENVLTGTPVMHSVSYTLHPSQSGTRYFFVKTNTANSFAETDITNNLSAAGIVNFAVAAPVDLIVSQISMPDTVFAGVNSYWQYTITNNGSGAGVGVATDSFFVSCNPLFSTTTAIYVGKKERDRNIAPGAAVTDTFSTVLPFTYQLSSCFPNDYFNNAYFFVKTNATDQIYEGANNNNNTTASSKKIIWNMLVDLQVNSVNGPASAIVGHPYSVSWKIQNIGANPSIGFDYSIDSIYISPDSVLNSNAVPFGVLKWNKRPVRDEVLDKYVTNNLINIPTGDYYVLVKTNAQIPSHIIGERNFSNNVNLIRDGMGKAKTISVVRNPLPDLVDSIISYPEMTSPGQPITVIHRIKNIGAGETYPNQIAVKLWLSDDPQGNQITYSLDSKRKKNIIIPAGDFVDDTIHTYIPRRAIARNYSLVTSLNDFDKIIETNELNNRTVVFINVFIPDPVDLVVTSLVSVDTALLGYAIDSVQYIVKNNSGNPAVGYTSDGFYLSTSDVFDSSAVLMGIKEKKINMQPLALDTLAHSPMISGVTEGSYNLFVNIDLTNTIPETNETNNTAMVPTPVYVKVKELFLGELESNTLFKDTRFYKLIIPDSLDGATISVKLVSEDSLTKVNQMFIGKGYVPDAAHFDYTYPTANYGNQDVIMDYTTAGTYYISFRCINSISVQNITLKARKLPFEISSIQSATGGNIGNVTVKINGSLFTEGMTAILNKSGTEVTASAIYFTNTTTVYATFNLQGKSLGIYDLTLSKGDTSFAVLNNGFSIVKADNGGLITGSGPNTGAGDGTEPGCDPGAASGLNSQLVTELIVPDKIFAGWPFVIQINFKNPTNYDIPAQVRSLYAEDIIKLGLTPESTFAGPHSLAIEITETDGPPGVIRAGGSGTIFIYGRSNDNVPGHTFSLVHLK